MDEWEWRVLVDSWEVGRGGFLVAKLGKNSIGYRSGSANASVKVFLKTHSRLLKLAKSKN